MQKAHLIVEETPRKCMCIRKGYHLSDGKNAGQEAKPVSKGIHNCTLRSDPHDKLVRSLWS